jgi:hypothetical protein
MGGEHGAYGFQGQMYTNEESEFVAYRHILLEIQEDDCSGTGGWESIVGP